LNYEAEGSVCYDNKPANCKKYGKLYNWNAAMKACPKGWHLPSHDEWQILVDFAGGRKIAGKKLKTTSGWNGDDDCWEDEEEDEDYSNRKSSNGTDTFGFSASPGGGGGFDGHFSFGYIDYHGNWWSAGETWNFRLITCSSDGVGWGGSAHDYLYSVRCLQD